MIRNAVLFSQIESLGASLQFLAFSEAYLDSAERLCDTLAAFPAKSTYPKGAVVMSLTFHGIELFLKAAILEKRPGEKFLGRAGQDLDHLHRKYANLYSAKKYALEVPFRADEAVLVNPDPQVLEELRLHVAEYKKVTPFDQVHRYPRDIEGKAWEGIFAFEASSFAGVISGVQDDISRLKGLIFCG